METGLTADQITFPIERDAASGHGGIELGDRCVALGNDRDLIRGQAGFHWWPTPLLVVET